jgi:hypothetical protein
MKVDKIKKNKTKNKYVGIRKAFDSERVSETMKLKTH